MDFEIINHGRAYLRERWVAPFKALGWLFVQGVFGFVLGFEMCSLAVQCSIIH
jgi:hypothetical protein